MLPNISLLNLRALTPSQDKEEPQLLGELAKNNHQHEVEHDTLTQHPAERSQKKVVQQGCYKCTGNLHSGSWIDTCETWLVNMFRKCIDKKLGTGISICQDSNLSLICSFSSILTVLLVAVSMPTINVRYPSSKEIDKFKCRNMWTALNNFFLQNEQTNVLQVPKHKKLLFTMQDAEWASST